MHVTFFRPSTESSLIVEVPFEVDDDPHVDERFVLWTIQEYPDWIPKAYLVKDNDGSND
tara:strand:+ start:99 stop:275 length:177 start_codon:yes stop_codon:yes gene_type:complete